MNTPPNWAAWPLLTVLLAPALSAQAASASNSSEKDDPIVLSPFTVSTEKDTGYHASDSLAGGRIATNVFKTPVDQTILTREFLDDTAAP